MTLPIIDQFAQQSLSSLGHCLPSFLRVPKQRLAFVLIIFSALTATAYALSRMCRFKARPVAPNPFRQLPFDMQKEIFLHVQDPSRIQTVCKDWQGIAQTHLFPQELQGIASYLGEPAIEAIYRRHTDADVNTLTDKIKVGLLFKDQRQRLFDLLGKDQAKAFLKSQSPTLNAACYQKIEQWIRDYNFILLCQKINHAQAQTICSQATQLIQVVANQHFDIASMAQQLRGLLPSVAQQQTSLDLTDCHLTELPIEIGLFTQLRILNLSKNHLRQLCPAIENLKLLEKLILHHNQLTELPSTIDKLNQLRILSLRDNRLRKLPTEIGNLTQLILLAFAENQLTEFPEIGNLLQLEYLYLWQNQLTQIPTTIGNLTRLKKLVLSSNQLTDLPSELGNCLQLKELYLTQNRLTQIPAWIGTLSRLKKLYFSSNQLTEVPSELGNCLQLELLHLWQNQLTQIPTTIGNLSRLKKLDLSSNQLTELPIEIGNLTRLKELDLNHNQLTELPTEIGKLIHLEKLELAYNKLKNLPTTMIYLTGLKNLSLFRNPLSDSFAMRQLEKDLFDKDYRWELTV